MGLFQQPVRRQKEWSMADDELAGLHIDREKGPTVHGKKRRYGYLLVFLLLLLAFTGLYRRGLLTLAVDVQVETVQRIYPSQSFTLLNASGYVVAQRKAAVASKVTGRLVSITVEEGSRVKKGQVIARLENDDAQAARERAQANVAFAYSSLEQAKAEIDDAHLNYSRKKELVEKGFIARADFDVAEARYKRAKAAVAAQEAALRASEAALKEAEVMVDYTLLRAPFDAVVLTKNADIGDIVTPLAAAAEAKAAVVTIADMDSLQAEVDVSESNIEQVKVGQPCEIQLDALPNDRFEGSVHMIVPTADRSKASVMVKVAFKEKDPRILPEMSVKVAFLSRAVTSQDRNPLKAIRFSGPSREGEQSFVFVVRGDRAVKTTIRVGRRMGDMAEVLDGVEVGDKVVVAPLDKVRDGTKIKLKEG
jgi:RND family efflux transporter MFP subunit